MRKREMAPCIPRRRASVLAALSLGFVASALSGCGAGGGPEESKIEGPVTLRATPAPVYFATPPPPPPL